MGILSRLIRIISGTAHSAMDKLEDGNIEIVTEQTLRDYDENICQVRSAIGNYEAELNIMQNKVKNNKSEMEKLDQFANSAIEQGKDTLAADYESKIMELESTNVFLQNQIDANKPKLENLTASYSQLLDRRNKAQLKIREISAQEKILKARKAVESIFDSTPGSLSSDLERISENTERKMLSQTAQERLSNGANYQERQDFEKEQVLGNVQNRLEARKKNLNKTI